MNGYDAYGIPNETNIGRFQYTGQIWLPELGLYYYKARIYSPTLGRFLQTDPIGYEGQYNLYAYVGNDPVNLVDPTGERSYIASRALDVTGADTLNIHHAFIVTNAKYLGDPDATITSFGELANGNTGNVSDPSRASDVSKTAAQTDRETWLAIAEGGENAAIADPIHARDSVVQTLADSVVENKDYFALPGVTSESTNSNSAAFAVARAAGDTRQPGLRGTSHPGQEQSNRVQFDKEKLCKSDDFKCD